MKHDLIRGLLKKCSLEVADILVKAKKEGDVPPCKAGCFACCYEPVYASSPEAELIADLIRGMPPKDQRRVRQGVQEWVEKFKATELIKEHQPPAIPYRQLRLACPLLKDGMCSVYEDRPFGCRTHYARKDPKGCEDDALRATQQYLAMNLYTSNPFEQLMKLGKGFVLDHLILLVNEALGGEPVPSGSRVEVEVQE